MKQLIECVPNFSEGRNPEIIKQITAEVETVEGVKLLDVDPGASTNRTVVTFVGEPQLVVESAFRVIRKAQELIDMRNHHGDHPRFGATDVCPLVPVAGITMEETAEYARQLAKRVGDELGIPVYCYENSAFKPERRNLANCRQGEYEALKERITSKEWKPDFGPNKFTESVAKSGASAIGARDFLIAVNFNLATTSVETATAIARQVREHGYQGRPGTLKCVKAIGWYIPEYGFAQVSCNLTNFHVTSLRQLFDEVSRVALLQGTRVTGTEIIGLVPEEALVPDAVSYLGLEQLRPFRQEEKVLEYVLNR